VVTADVIREAFKGVVLSHVAGLSWLSVWQPVLDESAECSDTFPACWWGPLSGAVTPVGDSLAPVDTFNIDALFVDQTATARSQDERDAAHSRMDAIARQCWRRFQDLYLSDITTFDGVTLDFQQDAVASFQPVFDDGPKMTTGVRMTVTLNAVSLDTCMDQYFNA
jgi:hypothetical protein